MRRLFFFSLIITGAMITMNSMGKSYYKDIFYKAYVNNKMHMWQEGMAVMERDFHKTKDMDLLYELTRAQYGYIAYRLGENDEEEAVYYLNKAEKNIERMLDYDKNWAEVYALRGAILGFRMSISPYKAVYLGPKSLDNINKAVELDSASPEVLLEKANAAFYTPVVFGGSKEAGLDYYNKTISLFEENKDIDRNWLYLNTLTVLAKHYQEEGKYQKAKNVYDKILDIEPDFKWVKNELYPELMKKTSQLVN